jgi:TolB-like protein/DNA-binding winged helix-turn-helix (wHTH) protein/Tfp pilus assembly protein PilF
MSRLTNHLYEFGEFRLDPQNRVLRRGPEPLPLTPKAFDVLLVLLRENGRVVTKDELMKAVWPDSFVEESNLTQTVFMLRKALGETLDRRYILTSQGKGYRIAVEVRTVSNGNAPELLAENSLESLATDSSPEAASEPAPAKGWEHSWQKLLLIAAAGLVLVLIAAAGIWFERSRDHAPQPAARTVLAVLPFENLTGDPGQEYFSDGLTEEMITELGRLDPEHLGVIGRTSVMVYKQNPKGLDQIGRELGVQYVLEGSIRRDSGNVRITAQLIQVKDQTHVWARQYDRELKNLLDLQSEIAQEVTDEITLTLHNQRAPSPANHPAITHARTSYEAYDLYLEGRYFWNQRTDLGFQRAADYFQQAIAKDPNYAQAYAGLADTYGLMSTWYMAPQSEFMPKARAAALKALELDDSLAEAHTSLALVAENYDYDWRTAEREFQRAIQLNPEYPTAHQWYAESLGWQGRFDEAFAESERARRLDPMSLIIARDYSKILYYSRQYDRAIAQGRVVSAMSNSAGSEVVCVSYVQQGEFAKALTELQSLPAPDDEPWIWAMRAYVYGRWHQEKQCEHALAKFEPLAPKLGFFRSSVSLLAYSGSGDEKENDKVLALLQKAYRERSPVLTQIKVDPQYDPLRNDPRFQELLRQVGLADEPHKSDK